MDAKNSHRGSDNSRRDVQLDAEQLEVMLWQQAHKIPNSYKGLWSKICEDAGLLCDAVYEAFDIPPQLLFDKYNTVCMAVCILRRVQRRLCIANMHHVCAISDDEKARLDIQSNKILSSLQRWSNSLKQKVRNEADFRSAEGNSRK